MHALWPLSARQTEQELQEAEDGGVEEREQDEEDEEERLEKCVLVNFCAFTTQCRPLACRQLRTHLTLA